MIVTAALLAIGPAPPRSTRLRDDRRFLEGEGGEFPAGWKPRKDSGKDAYKVAEEPGLRFLHAAVQGLGVRGEAVRGVESRHAPRARLVLAADRVPEGRDERESKANDSVLAVYMLVPYSNVRGPKAVKYVEREGPGRHPLPRTWASREVRVLRSGGPAKKGEWVEERVNVGDDYKKYFVVTETPKPAGIAVLTDADDTGSSAQGDYANFRACRQ